MSDLVAQLERQVLSLDSADRARILETLLASFDEQASIEDAWVDEALRRVAALERDPSLAVDGPTALAAVKSRFAAGAQ